ncbi:MAG TPA: hypothetical protein VF749_01940, partial [Candidatus Acidoferrum sp.]
RFIQNLSELGIAYGGSPIVAGAGKRYFDESLRGGRGIGNRFLLLLPENAGVSTKADAQRLSESLEGLVELRAARHPGIALVRPDGYVALTDDGRDATRVLESVRSLLKRQTN